MSQRPTADEPAGVPGLFHDYRPPVKNTDREIWRGPDEGNGSYYADSIHMTKEGALGINCGGHVVVMPIREWHRLGSIGRVLDQPGGPRKAGGMNGDS